MTLYNNRYEQSQFTCVYIQSLGEFRCSSQGTENKRVEISLTLDDSDCLSFSMKKIFSYGLLKKNCCNFKLLTYIFCYKMCLIQ